VLIRKPILYRILFASIAVTFCMALAFRPIPDIVANNDTGRYVEHQTDACKAPILRDDELTLSQKMFNLYARPVCWTGQPRVFMFWAALALPLALLLFGDWRTGSSVVLATGLLLSVSGFEIMTNALRQGAATILLLGALSLRRYNLRIAALIGALMMHDSSWFFAPLIFMVNRDRVSNFLSMSSKVFWTVGVIAGTAYFLTHRFEVQSLGAAEFIPFLLQRYSETKAWQFTVFMALPAYLVFFVRTVDAKGGVSRDEKTVLWYTTALYCLSVIMIPGIAYRYTMTACALQVVMTMKANNLSFKSSVVIGIGLVGHFVLYALFSNNVWGELHA
jgi:hypothetical protein